MAGADGTASEVTIRRAKLNLVDLAGSEKWNTKSDIQGGTDDCILNFCWEYLST